MNNLVGIFERGQLVGAWGTQRDVTEQKGTPAAQEYLSRTHSAKSSSQLQTDKSNRAQNRERSWLIAP